MQKTSPHNGNALKQRVYFDEFLGGEFDDVSEYRELTFDERKEMYERLGQLAEIMEGADFPWFIEGAVNISLYGDAFIRYHNDLDISLFLEDLEEFGDLLEEQELGIFARFNEEGRELFTRITLEDILSSGLIRFSHARTKTARTKTGETIESVGCIDLHVYDRDEKKNGVVHYTGTLLPRSFFNLTKKKMPNGKDVYLSSPILVAYHKMHADRDYDLGDLKILLSYLSKEESALLHTIIEHERAEIEDEIKEKLRRLWEFMVPVLSLTRDEKIIREKFFAHSDIALRVHKRCVVGYVEAMSSFLAQNPVIDLESFLAQSFEALNLGQRLNEKLELLQAT